MSKILFSFFWILISLVCGMFGCKPVEVSPKVAYCEKIVHAVQKNNLEYQVPNIVDKEKFLNDLMLSPCWKVEKTENGNFIARARCIHDDDYDCSENAPCSMFLFKFLKNGNKKLASGQILTNRYINVIENRADISATVSFGKPRRSQYCNFYQKEKIFKLHIWDMESGQAGLNSSSDLAFKISQKHEIYLIIHEVGNDKNRKSTFSLGQSVLDEIERLSKLPAKYYAKNIYRSFFKMRFSDLKENSLLARQPGSQGRDTFYGYFRTHKGIDYTGINIKISHPKYCGKDGECTRDYRRLEKAEYLGNPYFNEDLLYFQIEDNAVYLSEEKYDKMFGIFSGNKSFKAKLEVLSGKGKVLYENFYQFRGWER